MKHKLIIKKISSISEIEQIINAPNIEFDFANDIKVLDNDNLLIHTIEKEKTESKPQGIINKIKEEEKKEFKEIFIYAYCSADYHTKIPKEWIENCLDNIKNGIIYLLQNVDKKYEVEITASFYIYGKSTGDTHLENMINKNFGRIFYLDEITNHVAAMNHCIQIAYDSGYDYFFNINLDDTYEKERFLLQFNELEKGNADLVSSNYNIIDYKGNKIKICDFSNLDIQTEFNKNHNIIAHPVVAFNRQFWKMAGPYDEEEFTRAKAEKKSPEEDFKLWKKAIKNGLKFKILPQYLFNYRVHTNNVSKNN